MNDEATALTQPYLNFLNHLQEGLCEYWFEEMECESLLTINREFIVLCYIFYFITSLFYVTAGTGKYCFNLHIKSTSLSFFSAIP